MSDNQEKPAAPAAPVAYVPPSQISPAELMKALQEDGVVTPPEQPEAPKADATPVANSEPPKVEASPAVEAAPKEDLPALLRIAKERDAFRKEMESAKPHLEALRAIPPHTVSAIAKAIASGDPVSLLSAAGMTHAQYNARLLGLAEQKEAPPAESKENSLPPEVMTLRQELDALRQEREAEKYATARTQMLGQMREILSKDDARFSHINGLEDYEGVEKVLIDYHRENGTLPGATLEESVTLAAELYEANLKKEAARWQKVLTKGVGSAPVSSKTPASSSPGTVSARTLTNSNTSAPAPVKKLPKTRAEILDAIARGETDGLE